MVFDAVNAVLRVHWKMKKKKRSTLKPYRAQYTRILQTLSSHIIYTHTYWLRSYIRIRRRTNIGVTPFAASDLERPFSFIYLFRSVYFRRLSPSVISPPGVSFPRPPQRQRHDEILLSRASINIYSLRCPYNCSSSSTTPIRVPPDAHLSRYKYIFYICIHTYRPTFLFYASPFICIRLPRTVAVFAASYI